MAVSAKPIAIGAAALLALLFLGGKSKAKSNVIVPPAPAPTPAGPPPYWQDPPITVPKTARWLAWRIAQDRWRTFSDEEGKKNTAQADATAALVWLQAHTSQPSNGVLGPISGGVLMYFTPEVEVVLSGMGALRPNHPDGKPYTMGESLAEIAKGKEKAANAVTKVEGGMV